MLTWLVQNTITVALLAAVVAAGCRLFRFRPAVAHALWLVVLVKLLTPPLVHWPWPLPEWPAEQTAPLRSVANPVVTEPDDLADMTVGTVPESWAPARPEPADEEVSAGESDSLDQPPSVRSPAAEFPRSQPPSTIAVEIHPEAVAPAPSPPRRSAGPWLLIAWAAGSLAVFALQVHRIGRLLVMTRGATPTTALLNQVAQVSARLHVRPPRIVVTRTPTAPLLVGLGGPLLLWPAGLEDRLPTAALEGVLAHELAHLRRRDHWVGWLELAAACLWWWNPLFWYVRHRLREAAELACDAWVVHALPGGRRSYAEALLEVCRFVSRPVTPLPAVGMGNTARRSLERRLTMILRDRVPCRVPLVGFAAIALFWLAALPAWSTGQEADKQETAPATPAADAPAAAPADAPIPLPDAAPVVAPAPADDVPVRAASADPFQEPVEASAPPETRDPGVDVNVTVDAGPTDKPVLAGGVASAPAPDPQQRLDKLEAQLEMLLQEVRRLRGSDARPAMTAPQTPSLRIRTGPAPASTTATRPAQDRLVVPLPAMAPALPAAPALPQTPRAATRVPARTFDRAKPSRSASNAVSVRTLSRATYRLPEAKANALAQLLSEHAADIETKVDGDTLIVTAAPEAQQVIGQFIALLAGVKSFPPTTVPSQQPSQEVPQAVPARPSDATTQPPPFGSS